MGSVIQFIANLVGNNYLATALMSIVPLIELKGGIVFGRGVGLNIWLAFALAYAGSTIVFLLIFFLLKPILNLLKKIKWFNKFALKIEGYFQEKADETLAKRKDKLNGDVNKLTSEKYLTRVKQLGVFIFVAIPLPMTGVWTGTAIAVFLGLKFKDTILPIITGNLLAGALIVGLVEACVAIFGGVQPTLDIILYVLFGIALILLIFFIIKIIRHKPKTAELTVEEISQEDITQEKKTNSQDEE